MSKRSPKLLIEDMLDCISKIDRYCSGKIFEDIVNDSMLIDAIVRNLSVIGEAANRVPKSLQLQHQEIYWSEIIGLRNRIVHDYFGLDYELIWEIINNDLPQLQNSLERILVSFEN